MSKVKIKTVDTMTGKYVYVEVEQEIAEYIKRSYWREDMQERRFLKRKANLNGVLSARDSKTLVGEQKDFVEEITRRYEAEAVRALVCMLDYQEQELVRLLFVEEYTMTRVGEIIGVSTATVSRRIRRVYSKLRELYEEMR